MSDYETSIIPCGEGFNVYVTDKRTSEQLSAYAGSRFDADSMARGMEMNLDQSFRVAEQRERDAGEQA